MLPFEYATQLMMRMRQAEVLRDDDAAVALEAENALFTVRRLLLELNTVANHPSLIACDPEATEVDSESEVETVVDGSVGGNGEESEQVACRIQDFLPKIRNLERNPIGRK